MTEESLDTYLTPDLLIEVIKAQHKIRKPNSKMTDGEIGKVMRLIGQGAPDTIWIDGKARLGRTGIGVMLSLSLYQFPEFYVRYELWQRN